MAVPEDKVVEARHQTQHKLETMDRYWRIWCRILAQASGHEFCYQHVWLVGLPLRQPFFLTS
jgi:hypothetical protein